MKGILFFHQIFKIMKKLVLTLIAGFCIGQAGFAQEPARAKARKKISAAALSGSPAEVEKRDNAKIAKAKAAEANKAAAPKPTAAKETAN